MNTRSKAQSQSASTTTTSAQQQSTHEIGGNSSNHTGAVDSHTDHPSPAKVNDGALNAAVLPPAEQHHTKQHDPHDLLLQFSTLAQTASTRLDVDPGKWNKDHAMLVKNDMLGMYHMMIEMHNRLVQSEARAANVAKAAPPKQSYAQATTSIVPKAKVHTVKHTINVYPKSDDSDGQRITSNATRQLLKQVDITGLKVGVKAITNTAKGGVVVECRNKEEIDIISRAVQQADVGLDTKEHQKLNPRFSILLDGTGHDIAEIKADIIAKNDFFNSNPKAIEIVHHFTTRNNNTVMIVEVDGHYYQSLKQQRFAISVGWFADVRLRERDPVSQCRGCHKFGHIMRNCYLKEDDKPVTRCPRCSGIHDNHQECNVPHKCINCVERNQISTRRGWALVNESHGPRDRTCPTMIKRLQQARSQNYDYGQ